MQIRVRNLAKWAPDWRTVVSALLIVFAFPPWDLGPLIWFSLVPWFAALYRAPSLKDAAIQGVWLSYFMSLGGFHWVAYAIQEYGNLPWLLSQIGLQLFSIVGQPQFPVFAILFKFLQNRGFSYKFGSGRKTFLGWYELGLALVFAFSYVGLDWILPKIFIDTLGHALYQARFLRQLADIGGPLILTLLVFLVNQALWESFLKFRSGDYKRNHPIFCLRFVFVMILILLGIFYGYERSLTIQAAIQETPRKVQIAAIQGNIGDFDKIASERGVVGAAVKVLDTFMTLTDQALALEPRPELIIWPETSYPSTFRTPHSSIERALDSRLETFVKDRQIPLFFGGYDHFRNKDYNAFFLLDPNGDLQIYRKNILLLFGEYIPGADFFPFIKQAFPQVGFFGRGIGAQTLYFQPMDSKKQPIRTGPIICYEALFSSYLVESARNGSELIMNITNDSWFGRWGEPQLHLALTAFRSIETRLPMVRTTNTGISALILPDGEITSGTAIGEQKILNVTVPLLSPIPTLIKAWGDWFGPTALVFGTLGVVAVVKPRKRKKR